VKLKYIILGMHFVKISLVFEPFVEEFD